MKPSTLRQLLTLPVIVASLGYFVDVYDLLLFSIVRVESLKSLGIQEENLLNEGVFLINIQMAGLLIGGVIAGILGDKRGRISVLFASILIYSIATFLNGFVTGIGQYALLRFIAGLGLAGELGVGITLVAEILPKEIRGYGTSLVAGTGMFGAILAYFIADQFEWRTAYFIGGVLGLLLLIMRVNIYESGIFTRVKEGEVQRGNFFQLFSSSKQFFKYLRCLTLGIPIWFVVGILMTFAPEFGKALQLDGPVTSGKAVMWEYVGLVVGDISSGIISQYFRSRKKVVLFYLLLAAVLSIVYLFVPLQSTALFYAVCVGLGLAAGYWALFVTIGAEQFGTNLRATVATTAPNFVRGSMLIMTPLFVFFKEYFGIVNAAAFVGALAIGIALLSLWKMEETFSKNLDYIEK
jgi:MFS family permease